MKKLCIYLSLFLVFGCVSIRSNVGSVPKFSKILIILKMDKADDEYASRYLQIFPKKYEICAISHDTISLVSLKDKTDKSLSQCRSEVILTVSTEKVGFQLANVYGEYYSPQSMPYTLFLEMKSLADNKPFWKAQIKSNSETFDPVRVVSQLKIDGVLTE